MRILALDTATAATSVAVVGEGLAVERHVVEGRRHAESIAPLITEALDVAGVGPGDLDLVACGVGPGPFTGLRVGVATAVAMAAGCGIPAVGVCSLDVIARSALRETPVPLTVLTRARRAEVCWATYDASGLRIAGPLIRREPLEVVGRCVGDAGPVDSVAYPRAVDLADLVLERLAAGERIPTDLVLPEDDSSASGAPTAELLEARVRAGLVLLPPQPIYLRRPDAVAPVLVAAP